MEKLSTSPSFRSDLSDSGRDGIIVGENDVAHGSADMFAAKDANAVAAYDADAGQLLAEVFERLFKRGDEVAGVGNRVGGGNRRGDRVDVLRHVRGEAVATLLVCNGEDRHAKGATALAGFDAARFAEVVGIRLQPDELAVDDERALGELVERVGVPGGEEFRLRMEHRAVLLFEKKDICKSTTNGGTLCDVG